MDEESLRLWEAADRIDGKVEKPCYKIKSLANLHAFARLSRIERCLNS